VDFVFKDINLKIIFESNKRNFKYLHSWESIVARLKFKGIDGRAPPGVEYAV